MGANDDNKSAAVSFVSSSGSGDSIGNSRYGGNERLAAREADNSDDVQDEEKQQHGPTQDGRAPGPNLVPFTCMNIGQKLFF